MKKPAAKKPARPAGGGSGAAVPAKKAAPKKPVAKKPAAGRAAIAAHQAHVAHLAHLQHLGLSPKGAPKAAPKKARQLALGDGVACCAAEALAASLRLTGRRVDDGDVLALYRRTASDPDTGASIVATLEAASRFGLAGVRPVSFGPAFQPDLVPDVRFTDELHALILGVELPGPHAVLATPDGWWWSWGDLHDPATWPDAVIEEAWAVTWG